MLTNNFLHMIRCYGIRNICICGLWVNIAENTKYSVDFILNISIIEVVLDNNLFGDIYEYQHAIGKLEHHRQRQH